MAEEQPPSAFLIVRASVTSACAHSAGGRSMAYPVQLAFALARSGSSQIPAKRLPIRDCVISVAADVAVQFRRSRPIQT